MEIRRQLSVGAVRRTIRGVSFVVNGCYRNRECRTDGVRGLERVRKLLGRDPGNIRVEQFAPLRGIPRDRVLVLRSEANSPRCRGTVHRVTRTTGQKRLFRTIGTRCRRGGRVRRGGRTWKVLGMAYPSYKDRARIYLYRTGGPRGCKFECSNRVVYPIYKLLKGRTQKCSQRRIVRGTGRS